MCGISVVVNGSKDEAMKMGEAIRHRGIKHTISNPVDGLYVAHSLLPITDPNAGDQPYICGKYFIWLNGFISNWKELCFRYKINLNSNCDTEFLSKFIDHYGFSRLNELNGFFSIVVFDGQKIHAFTDRYGIKQLYYYKTGDTTYICSEVKGIKAVVELGIDEIGAKDWMYSLGVMNENTIYKGITRVPSIDFILRPKRKISYDDAKDRLNFLLNRSIERNKVHTVKDGVFLSGGIDSGIIANRMNPDFCFSMDYQDDQYSEIENIKKNSAGVHYGIICNQTLFNTTKAETVRVLDDLKAGSCFTNYALTQMASKFCTVLYSGAGGDEVFDGYSHRYDKDIGSVVKRTDNSDPVPFEKAGSKMTHKEYDWKFLRSVLVVEDRMSGNFTMETRYPLLDNDFVDFALSIPDEYRKNKRILKDISGLHPDVVAGRKRGFSNPYVTNTEWSKYALNETINLLYSF